MEAKDNVDTEGHNPKITSIVKEKIKDPTRVAQGKKLAAISRQAKERKAKEREAAAQEKWAVKFEKECFLSKSYGVYGVYALISVIAFGGYYFLYLRNGLRNPKKTEDNIQENRNEEPKKPNLEKL